VGAATFLERRAGELSGLRLHHPFGWGGYLASRLWPTYRIHMDGRSVFLDMIETGELHEDTSPQRWQQTLDERGIELALMSKKRPDIEGRPYWTLFMPAEKWELLYEDQVAVILRRRAAPRSARSRP
jgi:hypothetical protein